MLGIPVSLWRCQATAPPQQCHAHRLLCKGHRDHTCDIAGHQATSRRRHVQFRPSSRIHHVRHHHCVALHVTPLGMPFRKDLSRCCCGLVSFLQHIKGSSSASALVRFASLTCASGGEEQYSNQCPFNSARRTGSITSSRDLTDQ